MQLSKLYSKKGNEDVIIWEDSHNFDGFSVLREYPEGCGFIPTKNSSGDIDTKILIKVGYNKEEIDKDHTVVLYATASKFSNYLSGNFHYNFDDPKSPTRESINSSNQSLQPINVEDNGRYFFNTVAGDIKDKEKNKNVAVLDIVDDLYKSHLKTIRNPVLKSKIKTQNFICGRLIPWCIKKLKKLNEILFGKTLNLDKENWTEGIFTPYKFKSLVSNYPQSIPFFTSDIQISKINILWVSLTAILAWILYSPARQIDAVFGIAFALVLVFIFDNLFPKIILLVINALIRIRLVFERKRFKITP